MALPYKRNRYLIIVDLFGLLAIASTLSYYFWAHNNVARDEELATLWANLATEAVGIYLGVRLVEFLLRTDRERQQFRVGLVRGTRGVLRHARTASFQLRKLDVDLLQQELELANYFFDRRRKYLSSDEQADVSAFLIAVDEHLKLVEHTRQDILGRTDKRPTELDMLTLDASLLNIEVLRRQAEENIFEETAEE